MFIIRVSDDTPGHRETFYSGPYDSAEEAKALANRFNASKSGNWCAIVSMTSAMPEQADWQAEIAMSMLHN